MATKTKKVTRKSTTKRKASSKHATSRSRTVKHASASRTKRSRSGGWAIGIVLSLVAVSIGLTVAKATFFSSVNAAGVTPGFPSVSGSSIINGSGKPLLLRGAMIESSFAYINDYITKKVNPLDVLNATTFQAMQSWGMNAVRINISQWIQQADSTNQYLPRLDTAVAAANQAGLYVILDFHNDKQSGAVAPYNDEMLHKTSETWWTSIANRYKNNGMVMFDPANEPKYSNWKIWEHGDGNDIVGLLDVTQAIRQAGVKNIIVLEPGAAAGAQQSGWQGFTAADITDPNSIVSKHDYGEIPTGYLSSNATQYWEKDWGPFIGNRPLYYGEWALLPHPNYPSFCKGVSSANADAVTNAYLTYMQSIGANWTAWSFTPTHMIDSWTDLQPTSMQTGAPWTCPVTSGPAMSAGMGQDIKTFLAANPNPNPGQNQLKKIITAGDAEIARRLQKLNSLTTELNASTKLSSSDKTSLSNEVTNEVHGLTALKSKLDGESSVSAAKADVATLTTDYKAYAFLAPKIAIIASADWQQVVEANLALLATKLQTRIGTNQSLQKILDDMDKQITAAKGISSSVEKNVLPLQEPDYAKDHSLFVSYDTQLHQAHTDNGTAVADGQNIVLGLRVAGQVHTSGNKILDSHGNVLVLRGAQIEAVNRNIPNPDWNNLAASFKIMKTTWKMNVVRLPVCAWRWQANQTTYMGQIDSAVNLATTAGLYVIVDSHDDNNCNPVGYAPKTEAFHLPRPGMDTFIEALGQSLGKNPQVIFDLYNEPSIASVSKEQYSSADWQIWLNGATENDGTGKMVNYLGEQTLVNDFRKVDQVSPIMVEGYAHAETYLGIGSNVVQDPSHNVIYEVHNYSMNPTGTQTGNDAYWQMNYGFMGSTYPIFVGEWALMGGGNSGQDNCSNTPNAQSDTVVTWYLDYMKSNGWGWTAYSFSSEHLIDPKGDSKSTALDYTPTTFDGFTWTCGTQTPPIPGMGTVLLNYLKHN